METKEKLEVWRDIPGFENYQASSLGDVRSVDRTVITSRGNWTYKGRILKGHINKNTGYRQFGLRINGKMKTLNASQIIAMAYLSHTPDGHAKVVDHIDGDRSNDRLSNLRIVSHRENISTCFRKNRKMLSSKYVGVTCYKNKWVSQIVYEGKLVYLGLYDNELEASEAYQTGLAKIEDGTFNPDEYKPSFTSKYKGVTFHKQRKKWVAQIYVDGKQKHLGYFNTELEAFNAIQKFKQKSEINHLK